MILHTNKLSQAVFKYLSTEKHQLKSNINQIGTFISDFSDLSQIQYKDPVASVIINLLERGRPTLTSPYIDELLSSQFGVIERTKKKFELDYAFTGLEQEVLTGWIHKAFLLVKPDSSQDYLELFPFDSEAEKIFLSEKLDLWFGVTNASLLRQLVYPQREIATIIEQGEKFRNQRVDFSWELPGDDWKFIVEIDGGQHQDQGAMMADKHRDNALKNAGWRIIRITTTELYNDDSKKCQQLQAIIDHPIFQQPIQLTDDERRISAVALIPIAIGRIQRTLAELVLRGRLNWTSKQEWNLAIYERDIACSWIAIHDFIQLTRAFEQLTDIIIVPEIILTIIREPSCEYVLDVPDDLPFVCHVITLDEPLNYQQYDVLIDFSMRKPQNWTSLSVDLLQSAKTVVTVRSAFMSHITGQLHSQKAIHYYPNDDALRYFLQYLFRKDDFREGQRRIIDRALLGQDVIGLLATGGGKSVCYQLPALLQPSMTLIIDPLKSLMLDQRDDLRLVGIDRAEFINSSQPTRQRQQVIAGMKRGLYQFIFISPERLQIQEFRDSLQQMGAIRLYFAYAVVDEAHCVSEWGHDFRTAYLRLGHNLREYLPSAWDDVIKLVGLTGTASFDVLSDIQRDLGVLDDESVIRPNTLERKELRFEIIPVSVKHIPDNRFKQRAFIAEEKKNAIFALLSSLQSKFVDTPFEGMNFSQLDGDNTRCGIIFSPHRGGDFGVKTLYEAIDKKWGKTIGGNIGYFYGLDDEDYLPNNQSPDDEMLQMQNRFKRNELSLLLATKAFGMGVNKPNVRYTVHFNIPSSIESFYQEAGRAGRDREPAYCFILLTESDKYSDTEVPMYFYRQSFKGIDREIGIVYALLNEKVVGTTILQKWEMMSVGDTWLVTVQNSNFDQFLNWVKLRTGLKFDEVYMRKSAKDAKNFADFIARFIKHNHLSEKTGLDLKNDQEFERQFLSVRIDNNDIQKIIYRLATIGLVKDYTVDYSKRQHQLVIQKQRSGFYIDKLMSYIRLYLPTTEVDKLQQRITNQAGRNEILRSVTALIEFIYQRVAKKRREAIEVMHNAAKEGAKDSSIFVDRVNNYFSSTYIPEMAKSRVDYDISTVWRYMDEVETSADVMDRAKHLRGSCDRMLVDNPDNGSFHLLRAFATLLINRDSDEILTDARLGIQLFRDKDDLSHSQIAELTHQYCDRLIAIGDFSGSRVSEVLINELHQNWLQNFSQSYFEGIVSHD